APGRPVKGSGRVSSGAAMPRILTPADIAEFRGRLCDVAATLFAELGDEGFNMRELARRLGVSAMTPYRYFKDNDSILPEVRPRAFAALAHALEEAQARGLSPSRTYAQFALQHPAQYRLMFAMGPGPAGLPALSLCEQKVCAAFAAHLRGRAMGD